MRQQIKRNQQLAKLLSPLRKFQVADDQLGNEVEHVIPGGVDEEKEQAVRGYSTQILAHLWPSCSQ